MVVVLAIVVVVCSSSSSGCCFGNSSSGSSSSNIKEVVSLLVVGSVLCNIYYSPVLFQLDSSNLDSLRSKTSNLRSELEAAAKAKGSLALESKALESAQVLLLDKG